MISICLVYWIFQPIFENFNVISGYTEKSVRDTSLGDTRRHAILDHNDRVLRMTFTPPTKDERCSPIKCPDIFSEDIDCWRCHQTNV